MNRVCLIQNKNEMFHYEFADNRRMLENLNIEYDLITSSNLGDLKVDLASTYDCIILTTNALSDKKICELFHDEEFLVNFNNYLKMDKGLIIFSQYTYLKSNPNFHFLPQDLGDVSLVDRQVAGANKIDESATMGVATIPDFYKDHLLFIAPNKVNQANIASHAIASKNIAGLYWHYFSLQEKSMWQTLIVDDSYETIRPLVIQSKKYNIIISSILVDWQKHTTLFHNFIVNSISKDNYIGVISNGLSEDLGYKYLIKTLSINKVFTKIYDLKEDLDLIIENINKNVHNIIILSPNVSYQDLEGHKQFSDILCNNDIRIIDMKTNGKDNNFSLYSSSNSMKKYLLEAEYIIQQQITFGYVEDSFWRTVEAIQQMKHLAPDFQRRYNANNLKMVFKKVDERNVNGSYSETFNATCAKLWLYHNSLGINKELIDETYEWIINKIDHVNNFDYILGLFYLKVLDYPISLERIQKLKAIIENILNDNPNEVATLNIIRASLVFDFDQLLKTAITYAFTIKERNIWLDYSTTASITELLIRVYRLWKDQKINSDLIEELEQAIFGATYELRKFINLNWNNSHRDITVLTKAINVCKCFEDLVDFPAHDILTIIQKDESHPRNTSITTNTINILEELRINKHSLTNEVDALNETIKARDKEVNTLKNENLVNAKRIRRFQIYLALTVIVFYLLATTIYFIVKNKQFNNYLDKLVTKYIVVIIATLIPLAGAYWSLVKLLLKPKKGQ